MTEKIIGACIEVHRILGPGLLESIYEEALCHEFTLRNISFERQVPVDVVYKNHFLIRQLREDIITFYVIPVQAGIQMGGEEVDSGSEAGMTYCIHLPV